MTGLAYDLSPLSGDRAPQEVHSAYRSTAPAAGWLIGGTVVFVALVTTLVHSIGGNSDDLVIGLACLGFGALLWLAVWLVARLGDRRTAGRAARIAALARTNGFTFDTEGRSTGLPGVYTRDGHATVFDRVQWAVRGVPAEAGRYHRRKDGGYSTCFYLAVELDVDMEPAAFYCGRISPSARGAHWKGPDAFEGRPYSLRAGDRGLSPVTRELFDDRVVALLLDDEWPCNAEYVNGRFLAYYRSGDSADPGRWQHLLALADAVAEMKAALTGKG